MRVALTKRGYYKFNIALIKAIFNIRIYNLNNFFKIIQKKEHSAYKPKTELLITLHLF